METADEYKENLLLKNLLKTSVPETKTSLPTPGFCIKSKTDKGEKVFINICKCDDIPCPKTISDEDCIKLLESPEPNGFRVPLCLGDAHMETDKSNISCLAYDVAVNPAFYEEVIKREVLKRFFLILAFDGLENKHNITINRDFIILKNKKCMGSPLEVNIRKEKRPWILEVNDDNEVDNKQPKEEIKKGIQPKFKIIQEPKVGKPEFLVADIELPKVKMASSLTLDIGEDRLLLTTRSCAYHLDIFLPFTLNQGSCTAQFNRKTNILTVLMPVLE